MSALSVISRVTQPAALPFEQTLMGCFPDELILNIFRNLSVKDLRACSLSCKQLNTLTQDDSLRRSLFHRDFPHKNLLPSAISSEAYKEMYKIHSNIKKGVYSSMALTGGDPQDQVMCLTHVDGILHSGSAQGRIEAWDSKTGRRIAAFRVGVEHIHALAFADGKLFAAVGDEIQIMHYQTGIFIEVLTDHDEAVLDIAVHNGMLFSASADSTVRIWDLKTYECIHVIDHTHDVQGEDQVLVMIVTDDRLISGTMKGIVHIFDLNTLKTTGWGSVAHRDRINAMALDEEGRLITCSDDTTIKVWGRTGQWLRTLQGHTNGVGAFVRTGNMLISSSEDRTVRIWNYLTGDCLSVLEIDSLPPYQVCPLLFSDGLLFSVLADTQTEEERKIEIWNFKATEESILNEIATLFKSENPQDYTRAVTRFSRMPKGTQDKIYRELECILKEFMGKRPKILILDETRNGEKAFNDKDGHSSSLSQKAEAIELYLAKQKKQMQLLNKLA